MDHPDKHRSEGGSESMAYDSDDDVVRNTRSLSSASAPFGQHKTKRGHPIYSREDIREQYCINTKELEVFEDTAYATNRLFGCLSLTHLPEHSPCNKSSILPNCVKRKNSLDSQKGLRKGLKLDEEDDSDGGFKRRPKLRTTIALDQRYSWAAPTSCQDVGPASLTSYHLNASHRLPNSFAPDSLVLSSASSFVDRYPRDPSLHFVPRHTRPSPYQQFPLHQQQQYQIKQQQLHTSPSSQINGISYFPVNGYPLGTNTHQIPIFPHQIPYKGTTDNNPLYWETCRSVDELSGSCPSAGPGWMYQCMSSNQTPDLLLCEDKSKHVSFDTSLVRSNTIGGGIDAGSLDPASIKLREESFAEERRAASAITRDPNLNVSHERLISAGFAISPIPSNQLPESSLGNLSNYTMMPASYNSLRLIKRTTVVKTRATQTEAKSKPGRFKGSSKSVSEAVPTALTQKSHPETSSAVENRHDETKNRSVVASTEGVEILEPLAYLTLSPRASRRSMNGKSFVTSSGKVNFHYHKHSMSSTVSRKTPMIGDHDLLQERLSGLESETTAQDPQQPGGRIECTKQEIDEDSHRIHNQSLEGRSDNEEEEFCDKLQTAEDGAASVRSGAGAAAEATTVSERSESGSHLEQKSKRSLPSSQHASSTSTAVAAGMHQRRPLMIQRQRSTSSCKQEKKRRREQRQKHFSYSSSSDDEDAEEDHRSDPHRRYSIPDAAARLYSLPNPPPVLEFVTEKSGKLARELLQKEDAADAGAKIDSESSKYKQSESWEKEETDERSHFGSSSSSSTLQAFGDRVYNQQLQPELSLDSVRQQDRWQEKREKESSRSQESTTHVSGASLSEEPTSSSTETRPISGVHPRDEVVQRSPVTAVVASENTSLDDSEVVAVDPKIISGGRQEEHDEDQESEERRKREEIEQQCMQSFMGSLPSPSSDEASAISHVIELTSPEDEIECEEREKESGSSVYVTATDKTAKSSSKDKTTPTAAGGAERTTTTTYETASSSLFSLYSSPPSSGHRNSSQESESHPSPTNQDAIDFRPEPQALTGAGVTLLESEWGMAGPNARRVSLGSYGTGHDADFELGQPRRKHSLPFFHESEQKSESSEDTSTKKGDRLVISPGTASDSRSFEFPDDLDSEEGAAQGVGLHSSDPSTAMEASTVVERIPFVGAASSSSSQPESLDSSIKEMRMMVLMQDEDPFLHPPAAALTDLVRGGESNEMITTVKKDRESSSVSTFLPLMREESEQENESEEEKKECTTSEEYDNDPLPPMVQKVDDLAAFASGLFSRRTLSGELSTVSEVSEEISPPKSSGESDVDTTGSISPPHDDDRVGDDAPADAPAEVTEEEVVDKQGTLKAKRSRLRDLPSKEASVTGSSREQESSSSSNRGQAEGGREGEDSTSASIPGDEKKALSSSISASLTGSGEEGSIDAKSTATTTATPSSTKESISFRKQDISRNELEFDPTRDQPDNQLVHSVQPQEGAADDEEPEPEAEVLESHEVHDMESSQATDRDFAKSEFSLEHQSSQEIDDESLSGLGMHASGTHAAPTPPYHLMKAVSLDETSSSIVRRAGKGRPPLPAKSSLILELESRRSAGAGRSEFLRSRSQDVTSTTPSVLPSSTASGDFYDHSISYQPLPSCTSSMSTTFGGQQSALTETSQVSNLSDTQVQQQLKQHQEQAELAASSSSQSQSSPELKPIPFAKSVTIDIVYRSTTGMRVPSEDEDAGVYEESYAAHSWIYIPKKAEFDVWVQRLSNASAHSQEDDDTELTDAEKVFRKQFSSLTHRMIHRKASLEMFRRIITNNFHVDKSVVIKRTDGEFGFRIHGSRPVVVSAIEGGTPAEASGLEVGDIIVSLNDVNVLESSHSDIVKLAHSGPQTLRMDLVRTIGSIGSIPSEQLLPFGTCCIISGFLLAKPLRSSTWKKRWFSFNSDNCLYWSRKLEDSELLGVLKLRGCRVSWEGPTATRVITIRNADSGNLLLQVQAASTELALKWIKSMSTGMEKAAAASAGERERETDPYLLMTSKYFSSPPSSIVDPDCSGFLGKFSHQNKDITSTHAVGIILLHGYRAQSCSMVAKKNTFELVPPQTRFRHFWFMAESEVAKKRWLVAFEYSIDRWFKLKQITPSSSTESQ